MADKSNPGRLVWLWEETPPASVMDDGFRPWMELYPVQTDQPRGAVLVCPGGGYANRAPHEAEPIARRFNAAGLHAFVVHYRVAPHRYPAALLDAARALRLIRHHAGEWRVKPDKVAILGFSAGGHLAASVGVYFDEGDPHAEDPAQCPSCRPDALVLCYPVISSREFAHLGSFRNLLGENPPQEMLDKLSLELHVGPRTPPTFLWHTVADAGVPVENSLLFAQGLRRHGIPFEMHLYPEGRHGLGLAPEDPHVATWMELCCQWLAGMGW